MRAQQFLAILLGHTDLFGTMLASTDARWVKLTLSVPSSADLHDRFRGALVGGAIGDAMGRPNEGQPTVVACERKIREYRPWHGWTGGPKGTITDDTQMTMWLAESILEAAEEQRRKRGKTLGCRGALERRGTRE